MSCAGWDGPVADRGRGQHTCDCGDGQRGHERVAGHTTARWHLDGHRWKEGELVADGTPDTSLAVVVFGELLVCEETEEAATAARRISSRWNQKIADRKAYRLRRASSCFGYELGVLLLAVVFVIMSTAFLRRIRSRKPSRRRPRARQ